ncbi:ATP-binding cassette domain-containing protein [bacterium]|nr:ATP-binding cassette domain-containing protein [bacterium]
MTPVDTALDRDDIAITGVNFGYDGRLIVDDVSFRVKHREFVAIVGPNGGGKTTLLRLVLGLLQPASGRVEVFGTTPDAARRRVGYMPQEMRADPAFPVTAFDVVLMGRVRPFGRIRRADREAARRAIAEVGLGGFERARFGELSGGQRQRALIARALVAEPEMLLLDEPTANIDLRGEEAFYDLLRHLNERMTIVLVTHDLGLVSRTVRKVVCVNRFVEVHPTAELPADAILRLYGERMTAVHHGHHHAHGAGDAE